jgi:hypothetical protein
MIGIVGLESRKGSIQLVPAVPKFQTFKIRKLLAGDFRIQTNRERVLNFTTTVRLPHPLLIGVVECWRM